MPNYLVSYDISEKSEDNGGGALLRAMLKERNAVHRQLSVWTLASASSADALFEEFGICLDSHRDRLMVTEYNPRTRVTFGPRIT